MTNTNEPLSLPGFRDFLPEDAKKRQWLKNKLIEIFELWGYDPIETPTLERLELFAGQVGEDEKLFFKFQDPGGRNVALRYDQTVPTCRYVGQYSSQLTFPFKRYQIQSVFRAEKPQKGRYRELIHCDCDIFGTTSPLADAEVIALSIDIYKRLGFKQAKVLINDRALLKDMPYEAVVAIDKLKKIGEDGVIADMVSKGIETGKAREYLEFVKNIKPNETIKVILEYLENLGFDQSWYAFEPTIARSFSYSTGPIWEVVIPEFNSGSVLGGERYDKLVETVSGTNIPGTGFGLGFDRTLEAAEQMGLLPQMKTASKVLVTVFSPDLQKNSLQTSKVLRESGINAEIFPDSSVRLDKQLKYADSKGLEFVMIVGPDEVSNSVVTIKNLGTKVQTTGSLEKMVELLSEN